MNQDELESQLSAMFDGELPAAECDLLSRRLARDEQLRTRWSSYALVGAALRSEPVAAVSTDFARRVGAAIASRAERVPQRGVSRLWRNVALSASLAAGVAGTAVFMLRSSLLQNEALVAYTPTVERLAMPEGVASVAGPAASDTVIARQTGESSEPLSYVVPPNVSSRGQVLPATLANYVLAHSEYSSALTRRNLISALVGSDTAESPPVEVEQPTDGAQ